MSFNKFVPVLAVCMIVAGSAMAQTADSSSSALTTLQNIKVSGSTLPDALHITTQGVLLRAGNSVKSAQQNLLSIYKKQNNAFTADQISLVNHLSAVADQINDLYKNTSSTDGFADGLGLADSPNLKTAYVIESEAGKYQVDAKVQFNALQSNEKLKTRSNDKSQRLQAMGTLVNKMKSAEYDLAQLRLSRDLETTRLEVLRKDALEVSHAEIIAMGSERDLKRHISEIQTQRTKLQTQTSAKQATANQQLIDLKAQLDGAQKEQSDIEAQAKANVYQCITESEISAGGIEGGAVAAIAYPKDLADKPCESVEATLTKKVESNKRALGTLKGKLNALKSQNPVDCADDDQECQKTNEAVLGPAIAGYRAGIELQEKMLTTNQAWLEVVGEAKRSADAVNLARSEKTQLNLAKVDQSIRTLKSLQSTAQAASDSFSNEQIAKGLDGDITETTDAMKQLTDVKKLLDARRTNLGASIQAQEKVVSDLNEKIMLKQVEAGDTLPN